MESYRNYNSRVVHLLCLFNHSIKCEKKVRLKTFRSDIKYKYHTESNLISLKLMSYRVHRSPMP